MVLEDTDDWEPLWPSVAWRIIKMDGIKTVGRPLEIFIWKDDILSRVCVD